MRTKILIVIIIGAAVIFGGLVLWYFITHRCPESCDDRSVCTDDFCSKQTNYKCQHYSISDCCGNAKCENQETYEKCSADCPNCDDNNRCTADSFDYHLQKCANAPILENVCCGNGGCEAGEDYQTCARDCPNCDDNNQCTKDKYDYHQQKCVNEIIIPCCGNGICDRGAEARSNCSADCPDCNDNNRLTSDSFNYATQKCENAVTHYFIDDFEQGARSWNYNATPEDPTAVWEIKTEGNNTVFRGTGHNWAELTGKKWDNFIFKARFKIIRGAIHFNYRLWEQKRYFIGVGSGHLMLSKQIGDEFFSNLVEYHNVNLREGWHVIEIRGYGSILNIFVDNSLLIKYKDTQSPILSGGIGLETHDNSEFWIDDVEIKVISQKDVVYP
ncbi:MAG: hypothetical protein HY813_01920 [Candidatus Portnoybacteria bacterium]|nr:hypothetical protein [Candidatus Portnoybacteria bacterium]